MSAGEIPSSRKAIVVGAGPVGCLAAISLAKMGWTVEIYESRPDMRLPSSKVAAQQRSINLAMSARGIAAIRAIEPSAADRLLSAVIPMHGRMIHDIEGNQESQNYDRNGQCINSIGRATLNEDLLSEALSVPGVRVFFKRKVVSIDFNNKVMAVNDIETGQDSQISFHLCIGADGSYSVVRRQLMRVIRMDFHQSYIPHEYLELKMPAGTPRDIGGDPTFLLDPHHLHIWPRHTFMLIALPNKDKTFTCTLFAPTAEFERLSSPAVFLQWFKTQFPDALALIGEEALLRDFQQNPRSSLISIKANPYHYKDCAIILGDAAHAMVPFYGQGLNCGLEDVRVLHLLLRHEGVDPTTLLLGDQEDARLAQALTRYSETRHEDLIAISDLAMNNYVEMRHSVTTLPYIFRKTLDNLLYSLSSKQVTSDALMSLLSHLPFPSQSLTGWLPLYTMVTFRPDISYATAKKISERQTRILKITGWLSTVVGLSIVSATGVAILRRHR